MGLAHVLAVVAVSKDRLVLGEVLGFKFGSYKYTENTLREVSQIEGIFEGEKQAFPLSFIQNRIDDDMLFKLEEEWRMALASNNLNAPKVEDLQTSFQKLHTILVCLYCSSDDTNIICCSLII